MNIFCVSNLSMDNVVKMIDDRQDMNLIDCCAYHPNIGKRIQSAHTDIVLIDIDKIAITDVYALLDKLKETNITTVGLYDRDLTAYFVPLIDKGIGSFIPKSERTMNRMAQKLLKVQMGYFFMPGNMTPLLLTKLNEQKATHREQFIYHLHLRKIYLTGRETDVALLLMKKMKNKEIALSLGVTLGTVKIHVTNIYKKLGIGKRKNVVEMLNKLGK